MSLRVPRWGAGAVSVTLNGAPYEVEPGGYARLSRDFQPGDVVAITLPLEPRFTVADPRVDAVRGCVAVERGPEVLCLESLDTPENAHIDLVQVDPLFRPARTTARSGPRPHRDPAGRLAGLAVRRAWGGREQAPAGRSAGGCAPAVPLLGQPRPDHNAGLAAHRRPD